MSTNEPTLSIILTNDGLNVMLDTDRVGEIYGAGEQTYVTIKLISKYVVNLSGYRPYAKVSTDELLPMLRWMLGLD